MFVNALLLLLGATLCSCYAPSSDASILAQKVCDNPDKLIEGITGINQMIELADYLENTHPASKCRTKYLDSLLTLKKVLIVSNEDICSDAKLSAIEEFNRKFVSTIRKDTAQQKKEHLKAPALVKAFYMHYAYLVSSKCKQSLEQQLQETSFMITDERGEQADVKGFDMILQKFHQTFAIDVEERGYTDLLLPWKLIDSLPKSKKSEKYLRDAVIDAEHQKPVRVSIRVNGAQNLHSFQHVCRNNLRPIYAPSILPVIRLVNLGLYEDTAEPLEKILVENEHVRRMFGLAQLCETLMPVEAFDDPTMKEGKITTLEVERANQLRVEQPPVELPDNVVIETKIPAPAVQSLVDMNELNTLKDASRAQELIHALKKSRKVQERVTKRLLDIASAKVKSLFKASSNSGAVEPRHDEVEAEIMIEETSAASREKRSLYDSKTDFKFSVMKEGTREMSFSKCMAALFLSVVSMGVLVFKMLYMILLWCASVIVVVIYFPALWAYKGVKLISQLSG